MIIVPIQDGCEDLTHVKLLKYIYIILYIIPTIKFATFFFLFLGEKNILKSAEIDCYIIMYFMYLYSFLNACIKRKQNFNHSKSW